jgi:hypothetical protein
MGARIKFLSKIFGSCDKDEERDGVTADKSNNSSKTEGVGAIVVRCLRTSV